MFEQKCQGNALEDIVFKVNAVRVTHVRAMQNMVRQVRSRLVIVRHVMIMYVRVMHAMVWNVRELHVWTEISGQCITGQGTRGQCI
jgi:hypothetical protein